MSKGGHSTCAREFSEEEILNAIYGSKGIMSVVASCLNCHWNTAQKYVQMYDSAKSAMDAEVEISLDLAEQKIHEAISMDDVASAKWFLSKKGKHRGYGDEVKLNADIKSENVHFYIPSTTESHRKKSK